VKVVYHSNTQNIIKILLFLTFFTFRRKLFTVFDGHLLCERASNHNRLARVHLASVDVVIVCKLRNNLRKCISIFDIIYVTYVIL